MTETPGPTDAEFRLLGPLTIPEMSPFPVTPALHLLTDAVHDLQAVLGD